MHAEAGRSVHLQHGTAGLGQRLGDVVGHDVDAADIQVDDAADALGEEDVVGCTSSVTSVAVPPVLRLAVAFRYTVSPAAGTLSGVMPVRARSLVVWSSMSIWVSTFSCP